MKKLIVFFVLMFHNFCFAQNEMEHVKSFVNDILLNDNYDIVTYQKYIHHYNHHSKENKEEFEKYLETVKLLTTAYMEAAKDKRNIEVIDITKDKETIKAHIREDEILPSYRIYGVFYEKKFATAIVVNEKKEIISFLMSLVKGSDPSYPLFLTEKIEKE